MRDSARAACPARQPHAFETSGLSRSTALANMHAGNQRRTSLGQSSPVHTNAQKVCVDVPTDASEAALRISPAVQAQIVKLYLAGYNFVEIARELHRDRRTVAKICRLPDVQARVKEAREKLIVASADRCVDSILFAVDNETDGKLAFKLLIAFGVIPSAPQPLIEEQVVCEPIDPKRLALAQELARIALEHGSTQPLDHDELQRLASKTQPKTSAKSRPFDSRDP